MEAIAEYQVLTNTHSAQFGGNGVAINAITKSGTNQWRGSLFEYYRNDRILFKCRIRPAKEGVEVVRGVEPCSCQWTTKAAAELR